MRASILPYLLILFAFTLRAQTGCPGCLVDLPAGLPDDTLYLPSLPDGVAGQPYNQDVSFRMPKSTTPVNAVDSTTPPGLPISKIEIVAVEGLPPGMGWQPNQFVFQTASQTDGCVKFCGTPTVSDSFVLIVRLKATVFFVEQEATFPLRLNIAPPVSSTPGFSMENYIGCAPTTVTFTNNIPSGGNAGFTYAWDFGDSTTFDGENPPPHTYTTPGLYFVQYHATIDTAGWRLAAVTVIDDECTDLPGFGNPDLYIIIKDANGTPLYNSSPYINNTQLPYTFGLLLPMSTTANYTLEVWDEDSGIKGTDDLCGAISFNYISNDTLVSGGLEVALAIEHPVTEVTSVDTVFVNQQPADPQILASNGTEVCVGFDSIFLESTYGNGNQWYLDGEAILGATNFIFQPVVGGYYQVGILTSAGCEAISDSVLVNFIALPAPPVFVNTNNLLNVADPSILPADYAVQWMNFNAPLPGETGLTYCATQSGIYSLVVTDQSTGCTNVYTLPVTYDPAFDCTVATETPGAVPALRFYPNPVDAGAVTVELPGATGSADPVEIRVWDSSGRLVESRQSAPAAGRLHLDCAAWPAGLYTVAVFDASGVRGVGRVVRR